MTTTKKLVPLSFSIREFFTFPAIPIFSISYPFQSFSVFGKQNLTFQLVYQDLNNSNSIIKFEQSLDNIYFDDLVDTSGNPIIFNLNMNDNSFTINLFNINTAYIRFTLILNTHTSGSFTYFTYLTN